MHEYWVNALIIGISIFSRVTIRTLPLLQLKITHREENLSVGVCAKRHNEEPQICSKPLILFAKSTLPGFSGSRASLETEVTFLTQQRLEVQLDLTEVALDLFLLPSVLVLVVNPQVHLVFDITADRDLLGRFIFQVAVWHNIRSIVSRIHTWTWSYPLTSWTADQGPETTFSRRFCTKHRKLSLQVLPRLTTTVWTLVRKYKKHSNITTKGGVGQKWSSNVRKTVVTQPQNTPEDWDFSRVSSLVSEGPGRSALLWIQAWLLEVTSVREVTSMLTELRGSLCESQMPVQSARRWHSCLQSLQPDASFQRSTFSTLLLHQK